MDWKAIAVELGYNLESLPPELTDEQLEAVVGGKDLEEGRRAIGTLVSAPFQMFGALGQGLSGSK